MRTHVANHPLITHKLTVLRDAATPSSLFRQVTNELVTLLAYEATRCVRVTPVDVTTPVATARGVRVSEPRPLVVDENGYIVPGLGDAGDRLYGTV